MTDLDYIKSYRFFTYPMYINALKGLLKMYSSTFYELDVIGKSVQERAIYGLKLGCGSQRILMWSQMHGNESTTTRSLLLIVDWFLKSGFKDKFELYIIPVLNPDGLEQWTRENANGVDLNRDAQELSQPESKILRTAFNTFKPHFCFNLHDQRTIYGNLNGDKAVQCSFLAPAADEQRTVTPSRVKAMHIINNIVDTINNDVSDAIGRYNDAFNINCVGDTFQSLGVPTVLFEAGQSDTDYHREHTMQIMFKSLKAALKTILLTVDENQKRIIDNYESIPSIAQNFCDILIKSVPSGNELVNLSIMYSEVLEDGKLYFVPRLTGINDKGVKNGIRTIYFDDKKGHSADFCVNKGHVFESLSLRIQIFC